MFSVHIIMIKKIFVFMSSSLSLKNAFFSFTCGRFYSLIYVCSFELLINILQLCKFNYIAKSSISSDK